MVANPNNNAGGRGRVLFAAVLFLICCTGYGATSGVQLYGAGSPNTASVLSVWTNSYLFYRDDVSFNYAGDGVTASLTSYDAGDVDFVCLDRGIPEDQVETYGGLVQFPLAGQALVMAYNIPSLPSTTNLVIERETLGLIWSGSITKWNDNRIQSRNLGVTLPDEPIIIGYQDSDVLTITEVVKRALESFSEDFRTALAAAGDTTALRINWLKAHNNSITFLNYADAFNSGLPWMNMINKAGSLVKPSTASVQSAMTDFLDEYSQNNFTVDIYDANGTASWPMAYMTFFALGKNISAIDCTNIQELLQFIAWVHTNDEVSKAAERINVAPLDLSLRKRLIDLLSTVQCNGEEAFASEFLIGIGTPLPVFPAWANAWGSATRKAKYYDASSLQAKEDLVTYTEDFGVTSNGMAESYYTRMPDVALFPATVFALVPAYNIPELRGMTLVLDFKTIAGIYLNNITTWSDQRIKDLNSPAVAAALPNETIIVVIHEVQSAYTQLFTSMLSTMVPEFNETIGVSLLPTFPVELVPNRTVSTAVVSGVGPLLDSTKYSFAFWQLHDVLLLRNLDGASMHNKAGNVVAASTATVTNALSDYIASRSTYDYTGIVLAPGSESWPIATFGSMIYRSQTMDDCLKAAALADFIIWSQTDPNALKIADRQGFVVASSVDVIAREGLNQIKKFTCDGEPVSALYGCIWDGQLCSSAGTCTNGVCVCDSGREGQYCQEYTSSGSSDVVILLATIIPVVSVIFCLLLAFILVLFFVLKRNGNHSDDWEIAYDELEVGEHLGSGGYGEVHKAVWKGTEVAVKVMASDKISKEMEKGFKEEVRVMTSLRHPNVVLFMAASTKAPKMCIVMEYMALGSLFDLLHNELIPEIPFALKAKMAYQASKGMHFLHSSGIVHRDLKSLNLLLDNKWNVKVSDFGLTKFKEDINKNGVRDIAGSVHWTAPEVLNESGDVDFILADVYSFGIILWELLTRDQPYFGLSPAAVAVAVIRDGIRPKLPESSSGACPPEYEELITSCWHHDPTIRPTFLEIMTRLSSMHGDSTSAGATSFTSKTSSSSGHSGGGGKPNIYNSWTMPSTNSSSNGSSSSNSSKNHSAVATAGVGAVRAPEGEVAIVFTDITRAASLWEFNAAAMRDATLVHNETLRAALKKHQGYEVVFIRDRNSGEGSFCMAFQHASDALAWCSEVQQALLTVEWPEALLEHPGAAEEWGDTDDRVLYKGLRVRMGVHVGTPRVVRDPMTRRVEYIGPVVNIAARITAMTHGGQVVVSHSTHDKVKDSELAKERNRIVCLGKFEMPDASPVGAKLYELKVAGLEGRFFGGVTNNNDGDGVASSSNNPSSGSEHHAGVRKGNQETNNGDGELKEMSGVSTASSEGRGGGGEVQTMVGEGMMFKEDTFLTSANLCRWIIDFHEIQVGKQIGLGSYGVVFRGKWKGVEVAVKRFIKQKLDERRMLEFRAEMAFLSELHHPNIVLFIGACVKKPNLCIVTEFMKQGSLKDILSNNTIKLTWKQKLRLLRSAALGLNYLHSLHPVIVHRDVKPSNLLVDENWNVKVADFGFARIKEENATMTRCGTPCWTAPEIIRGEKYDERADVFSFGVVMWQVLTRKEPFAGRNFMGVSLDVLEGKRPQIPNDCPADFRKVMKKCWHASAEKRPPMEDVVRFLDTQVGDDEGSAFATNALV